MNSFGILNQMEKTGKMWGILSDCEPPPTKKPQRKEDRQESNRNYKKKTNDHKHFKRVGRKARETIAQNPLKAHSSFL